MQVINDKELIERIQGKSDQLAYAELMERYRKSLYYTILKMVNNRDDAEDLTMEAFSKAFNSLESYDHKYAFSTWLFKIATNNTIDFIRKKRLETTSLDKKINQEEEDGREFSDLITDDKADPEEKYILEQRNLLMKELIDELDPKYKDLIHLRYYKEMKYEEIADTLQLPVGTVKVRLSRAKSLLAKILSNHKGRY